MTNKEDEEFYHNLPRKELQVLCKKYGLPANRSSSEMAESLVSYFEKHNGRSISLEEQFSGTQGALLSSSLTPQLHPGVPSKFMKNAGKDGYGLIFCPRAESNRMLYAQSMSCNELCYCGGHKSNYKGTLDNEEFPTTSFCKNYSGFVTDGKGCISQIQHRDKNIAGCPISLLTSTTVPSPSFEFYVSSDEGLNLCVDLNSGPSDWIKKFKNEVDICENMCHNKSESFQQELGRFVESSKQIKSSFIMTTDTGENKDDFTQAGCSPHSFSRELSCMGFDHSDVGNGSIMSSAINPSGIAADETQHLEEDQRLISLEAISIAQKDGHIINLDSDAAKSGGDSVAILSDGSTSIVTLEHQISKHDNETCENSAMLNFSNLVNGGVVLPGCLGSGSVEMPSSKVEFQYEDSTSSPFKSDRFLDLVDPMPNIETENGDLVSSRKLHNSCGNHSPTCIDEQERSKIINGGEDSECSRFDGSLEDSCLMPDNLESKEEQCRKRAHMDGDDDTDYDRPDVMILRRSKNQAGKVLPRRSMRLVSK